MLNGGDDSHVPSPCVWRNKSSGFHENTMFVKPVLSAPVLFLGCSSSVRVCVWYRWILTHPSRNHCLGGVSRATLALPGNLTSGSELSQLRSEVLFNGLSELCLLI